MKAAFGCTPVLALALLAGCTSTSKVLREPPKEGVAVAGINVLYVIVPMNFVKKTYGGFGGFGDKAPRPATRDEMKDHQDHAEHLRDQLSERLLPQLQMAGIRTEFASHQVVSGISPTPIGKLFPSSHQDLHLLVITPISESTVCSPTCTTLVKLSMSLRTPRENKEVWNTQIVQGNGTGANWMRDRYYPIIDDIAKSVLKVTAPAYEYRPPKQAHRSSY